MAQVSLYMEPSAMDALRNRAKDAGVSISHYVAGLLDSSHQNNWPAGYWEGVYGVLHDGSFALPNDPPPRASDVPSFD